MGQPAALSSSGRRKYTAILEDLVAHGFSRVACDLVYARTIVDGVKKEKVMWVKRAKWPKGKALKIDIIDEKEYKGLLIKMIEDLSINNL